MGPRDLGLAGDALLGERIARFVPWQVARWPRLARARHDLRAARVRRLDVGGREVLVQWNPGREANTTARVDSASIAARPCFLCPGSLPPEEGALAFGELVVLCNPAPILDDHLVIAHRGHVPQQAPAAVGPLLSFVAAAPAFTAIFNGPRAGASAPDHLHLQAFARGALPVEREVTGRRWIDSDRRLVGFRGPRLHVEADLAVALGALGGADLNLVAWAEGPEVVALLFPRGAHRPRCYFAEDDARLVVSPGAVDVAGFVVTVREADYLRLDEAILAGIFAEVSLCAADWAALTSFLRGSWNRG